MTADPRYVASALKIDLFNLAATYNRFGLRNKAEGATVPVTTNDNSDNQPRLTVYFDGACPLCRREIGFYRGCDGADNIAWVDVSGQDDNELLKQGLTRKAALKRFHIERQDGKLASGALAFAELWMALPGFAWAGRILALPGVRHVGEAFYVLFLAVRPLIQKITPR